MFNLVIYINAGIIARFIYSIAFNTFIYIYEQ